MNKQMAPAKDIHAVDTFFTKHQSCNVLLRSNFLSCLWINVYSSPRVAPPIADVASVAADVDMLAPESAPPEDIGAKGTKTT
mmetsp:Transcript_3634/g.4837  ORF Transcript_3634/g.4837 Transcript_3634/m.4837 type:complete len:82 (-) Transcript_3634:1005-1250(-)